MGWLNTILVRKARRFLWCVTGGMFLVLLVLSCVEVKSSCSDVWDKAMNILFYLWLMILMVSLGVTIVVACCEKKWGWLPTLKDLINKSSWRTELCPNTRVEMQ